MKPDFQPPRLHIKQEGEKKFTDPAMIEVLRSVLEQGHSLRVRATGTSMTPFIRDNDVITISPLDQRRLKTGQVVAFFFHPESKLCVHRITEITHDGLITWGDNLMIPDGIVSFEQVLGLVTRVERNGRNISADTGFEKKWIARFRHGKASRGSIAGLKTIRMILRKASHGR